MRLGCGGCLVSVVLGLGLAAGTACVGFRSLQELDVQAAVSLEVEAARGHRRYLRLDVERFALGRQWLPGVVVRPLLSRGVHDLFRWPLPAAVEAITIDSEKVVVRTAS